MKKIFAKMLPLFVLLLCILTSCNGNVNNEETAINTGDPAQSLKVGLLLSGPVNDGGWNSSAYGGLQSIEEKFGCTVQYQESIAPSDFEEVFRSFAEEGFDIVFGHGYEFNEAALSTAPDYPDVKFCITSSEIFAEPNVCSMKNNYFDMGYVLGALAAQTTETGHVAYIGGVDMPPISEPMYAFEAGAKSVKPNITVSTIMTGSFEDVLKAKEAALTLINQGADILVPNADQSGLGVFDACKEQGVFAFGTISDQAPYAPDTIITSGVCDISLGMAGIVDLLLDGTWEPQYYKMGIQQEAVYLADYGALAGEVSADTQVIIDQLIEDIQSGAINTEELTNAYLAAK